MRVGPNVLASSFGVWLSLSAGLAHAQTPPAPTPPSAPAAPTAPTAPSIPGGGASPTAPERSSGAGTASEVLAISSVALVALLPRIFYADPEVTAGWKGRFHLSTLAPTMTVVALALLNEQTLKGAFEGARPGCDGNPPFAECQTYGFLSTPSFAAGAALGQGAGVFLVDTLRWSRGSIHAGSLIGNVGVPLVLAPITTVLRTSGNWETGGQAWGSALIGLGVGFGLGLLYAELQRPECGYTGNLICW